MGFTASGTTSNIMNIETFEKAFTAIRAKINDHSFISTESQGAVHAELIELTQSFKQTDFAQFTLSSNELLALSDLIMIFSQLKYLFKKDDFNACLKLVHSHLQEHRMQEEIFLTPDSITKILPSLVADIPSQKEEMLFEEISLHLRVTTNPLGIAQICNFIFCVGYINNLDIKYVALESLALHVKKHLTTIFISNKPEYHDEKMAKTFEGAVLYLASFEGDIKNNPSFLSFLPSIQVLSKVLKPFSRHTAEKKLIKEAKQENQREQTLVECTPFHPTRDANKATSSLTPESSDEEPYIPRKLELFY